MRDLSSPEAPAAGSPALGRGSLRAVLLGLCVTEIVSYGVIFYAFTVLLPQIQAETGWGRTAITAAFSMGSVVGGVVGIVTGRILQDRGPWLVMTTGSVLGTAAILALAWSPNYALFFAAWVLAGTASACLFYPLAFAALTGWFGSRSVQAITTLTLAAGFSSTLFAPLTCRGARPTSFSPSPWGPSPCRSTCSSCATRGLDGNAPDTEGAEVAEPPDQVDTLTRPHTSVIATSSAVVRSCSPPQPGPSWRSLRTPQWSTSFPC